MLSAEQLAFFYKYGFVVVRGLHTQGQIKKALAGAKSLLSKEKKALDGGKGEQAFGTLPEGSRSSWGRCTEPRLTGFFTFKRNEQMVRSLIGDFDFKHHDGPGFYTFAPRFHRWAQAPTRTPKHKSQTVPPYTPSALPDSLTPFAGQFIRHAGELGIRLAPSQDTNWHVDGWDYNHVMGFNMLWGSYITALPAGNMGNLQVYPGTHHLLAKVFAKRGGYWLYDGKKEPAPSNEELPKLGHPDLAEAQCFQVCVEAGDVVLAHPWLAHGIGTNTSDQHRLAVYARLGARNFYWPPEDCQRRQMAGQSLGDKPWEGKYGKGFRWKGDYWANLPGLNKWARQNRAAQDAYDGQALKRALRTLDARENL